MNASTFIVATQVAQTSLDRADVVFARLGSLVRDEGETLAAIARLCGRPEIMRHLAEIEALHRDPGGNDSPTIRAAIGILAALHDRLATLPVNPEPTGAQHEDDPALLEGLDAAIRYVGARVEEHLRAMRRLLP